MQVYRANTGESVSVLTGADTFNQISTWIESYSRVAWLVDANVLALHQDRLQAVFGEDLVITVPSGESSKSRQLKSEIEDQLFAAGLGRDACIVAVGGGVVGDLAGFIAATYMRGIALIQVPTTIVSMVDSSIGGKTGIDIPAGKNLLGAFKHPVAIISDPIFLTSLPAELWRDGAAEMVKHAAIADPDLWQKLIAAPDKVMQRDGEWIVSIIEQNQKVKINVVTQDTQEQGLRKTLNFGHTIGHAIEHKAKFVRSHGICIAEGMLIEAQLAVDLELAESSLICDLYQLLRAIGFRRENLCTDFDADDLVAITQTDKKNRAGQVNYALCTRIGKMAAADSGYGLPIDDSTAIAAINRYRQWFKAQAD